MIEGISKLYMDANCIIYFVERSDALQQKISDLLLYAAEHSIGIGCSEIGIAECLYEAFKLGNPALEATYHEIFYDIFPSLSFAPLTASKPLKPQGLVPRNPSNLLTLYILQQQYR